MALIKNVAGNPDPLASFEEKKTDEYGLKIANRIGAEWFDGTTIAAGCEFMKRREYVVGNRLFVRGEHDEKVHKDLAKRGSNDINLLNIDWENINWTEKFSRIISNGISEETYRLNVRATDTLSVKMKNDKADTLRKYMASRTMLEKAKQIQGLDLMPAGGIPEDEDELQLHLQIRDRLKIEECEEILIDFVKSTNDWDYIHNTVNVDAVDNGLLFARVYTDKNDGVKIDYVDPENYIHSAVNRNDFKDKFYEGVVDTITLSDLRRESDFSESDLRMIAKTYASTNGASNTFRFEDCSIDELIDYKIDVLRFAWKTSKEIRFKKKIRKGETVKVSRKSDTYEAPNRSDVDLLVKKLDTWFEGNYVIGANAIYGYQECENLARDTMNKALSPFVTRATNIYKNTPRSFLTNIKPIARRLQDAILKLQLLIAELRPDTIEIDVNQLAEIDNGKGDNTEAWREALDIFQVKGIALSKRINMGEDGIKDGPAINARAQSQGSAIPHVMNAIAYYYNQIRDITGVNPARDGSMSPDALVGVNQMAQLASNTATKHIVDASVDFNLKVCELISTRLHAIFKHKDAAHLKEIYVNAVGKHFVDAMEILSDRHLHEFGFVFEMMPTAEEIKEFSELLSLCVQDQSIDGEVVMQSKRIAKTNIKLATDYLFYERKKRNKQRQEEQMAMAKNKSENDSAAAQAKVQAEISGYQAKKSTDIQYESAMAKIRTEEYMAKKQLDAPDNEVKFNQEIYLKKLESYTALNKETFKEDRKDSRTEKQAGQQSKLIDQRAKSKEPIDFENNFDFDTMMQ